MPFFNKFKRQFQKTKDNSSSFSAESSEVEQGSPAGPQAGSLHSGSGSFDRSPATSYLPVPPHIESPTYKVYVKYDVATPPPRPPGDCWTRFVCVSDTYGEAFAVPSGDVLLHAGNLTASGRLQEFKNTIDWLSSLDHPIKILVAGSKDVTLHREFYDKNGFVAHNEAEKEDYDAIINLLKGSRTRQAGIVYLEDSSFSFKLRENSRTWRIYGFPWIVRWGNNSAFAYLPFPVAEDHVSKIPPTDILLSHGPPNGILDETTRDGLSGLHVGCLTLLEHMKRIRPYLHVFGHVFEGHGAEVRMHDPEGVAETLEINATVLPNFISGGGGGSGSSNSQDRFRGDTPSGGQPPIILDIYDVEY